MKDKSLLLIGSSGFLGKSLLPTLSIQYQLTPLAESQGNFNWNNPSLLRSHLDKNPKAIVLFTSGRSFIGSSKEILQAEYKFHSEAFEIIDEYPDAKIAFISSGGALVSNTPTETPFTEEEKPNSPSEYGQLKLKLENILLNQYNQSIKKILIIRPSIIYGPGFDINKKQGIIGLALTKLLKNEVLLLYVSPKTVRDFLYISDFERGMVNLLEKLNRNELQHQIYHLSHGVSNSIEEILNIIRDVTKKELKIQMSENAFFSQHPQKICLSNNRLTQECHWHPQVSLQEGIYQTWLFLQKSYRTR